MKTYRVMVYVEEGDLDAESKILDAPRRLGRGHESAEEANRLYYHLIEYADYLEDVKDSLREKIETDMMEADAEEANIHYEQAKEEPAWTRKKH